MRINIALLSCLLFVILGSCGILPSFGESSHYESVKQRTNTLIIESNVKNFQISYDNMTHRNFKRIKDLSLTTQSGVYSYYIPRLSRSFVKFKVESPGYVSKEVVVKRTIGFNNLLQIPKKGRNIKIDLEPQP